MAVSFLPFRFPGLDSVGCLFQMRGGHTGDIVSDGTVAFKEGLDRAGVTATRKALLAETGASAFGEMRQVHGDRLVFDPDPVAPDEEPVIEADGLATDRPGLALLIRTADCQPVLLAHRTGRCIAALHVGWRGDRQLFPYTAVRRFCEHYDVRPADCYAVRGPSLGPARSQFIHYAVEWGEYFSKYLNFADSTMDLWSMTRDQLQEAGVPGRHIFSLDICTASTDAFFSWRRDRTPGRQAAIIWRKP